MSSNYHPRSCYKGFKNELKHSYIAQVCWGGLLNGDGSCIPALAKIFVNSYTLGLARPTGTDRKPQVRTYFSAESSPMSYAVCYWHPFAFFLKANGQFNSSTAPGGACADAHAAWTAASKEEGSTKRTLGGIFWFFMLNLFHPFWSPKSIQKVKGPPSNLSIMWSESLPQPIGPMDAVGAWEVPSEDVMWLSMDVFKWESKPITHHILWTLHLNGF